MVTAAAGMATTGLIPYVATFASFLALLCCEQIRTDVAYTNLPVRLIGHHAGITLGFYGTSHHATEDLAIMRSIADLDGRRAGRRARRWPPRCGPRSTLEQPIYFRIGRGREPDVYAERASTSSSGSAIVHSRGQRPHAHRHRLDGRARARRGRAARAPRDVRVGLIDMHTIKPLDTPPCSRPPTARPR